MVRKIFCNHRERLTLTKYFLEQQYSIEKKSTTQIAKMVGCSHMTVSRYLRKFNISRRERSESIHLSRKNNFIMGDAVRTYIDGLLLGDGSIPKARKYAANYYHGCSIKSEQWLKKIKSDFECFGIDSTIKKYVVPARIIKGKRVASSDAIMLYTKSYEEFKIFRERWYPNGTKIIPKDVSITPFLLANWFMGDGNYNKTPLSLSLATNKFTKEDICFIIHEIYDVLGVAFHIVTADANQFIMQLTKKIDVQKFLEYIEPCRISCFNYKWGKN